MSPWFPSLLGGLALSLAAPPQLLAQAVPTPAQTPRFAGILSGTVNDPSGAKVGGAQVHIESQSHLENPTLTRDSTTDATGRFSVDLPPGTYRLLITSPGFEPLLREGIVLRDRALPPLNLNLRIATENEVLNIDANNSNSTSAGDNASSLVFKKEQLDTLSSDDATLQQQILAIAGGDGQHPPQVYIDGFSGGRFPPKSSIREIRINQNPYSAQYEGLGFGRVEIFTKPGTDKLHGYLQSSGNDRAFNARNPFTGAQPPYHTLYIDGNVSGPIGKKTSFFLSSNYNDQQNNAVINAVTLDQNLNQTALSQAVADPQTSHSYSARLDRQLTTNNTFTARYEYNQNLVTNGGIGLLTLASEGFNNTATTQTLQVGNTQTIGPHLVSETRFQYIRTRLNQTAVSSAPTLIVQGSFNGGGAGSQFLRDNQDRYEFQEYLSVDHGKHFLRAGARYRLVRDANLSTGNYNGQYTFPDLATYQLTEKGLAQGLTPAQIRASGGGATQFNLTAGQPSASVLTGDLGLYADDEWKLTKAFTLNLGARFETQSGIPDHVDPAPRLGFAWAVHQADKKPAWVTLRGGFGLFYDRFDSSNLLTAARQNGITQQTYYLKNPDFYPAIPPPSALTGTSPATYQVSPNLRSEYDIIGGISAERSLGKIGSITTTYLNIRGVHQWLSRNVNAPLPGTYNPADPTSGVRPLGGTDNLYQFSSDGLSRGNILFTNYNLHPVKWINIWGFYIVQHANSDASGASNFVSNSYNVHADYARSIWNITNRLFTGGTITLPRGFTLEPFLIARGGRTFNITTGADNNGDTIYNDRPSFATDLTRPSVVRTRFGNFDTDPIAGQTIIPANFGTGPTYISLQLSLSKSFKFGPRPAVETEAPPPAGAPPTKPGAAPPKPDPRYELGFSTEAQNIFNHVNGAVPIGILTSPYFGKSISLEGGFFNNSAANRTVNVRAFFRF